MRSGAPSSGFSRYTNPLDEVGTGKVARFASSAREIVALAPSAAARPPSTLPVCTPGFVTRTVNTSDPDCAKTCPLIKHPPIAARMILVTSVSVLLVDVDLRRRHRAVRL